MIRRFSAYVAVALVASCAVAQAGVMVNVVQQTSPGAGLDSYLVQLVGTGGANVSTVRSFSLTNTHQVWNNSIGGPAATQTPRQGDTNGTFGNSSWQAYDTHVKTLPGNTTSPNFAITETNSGSNPTGLSWVPSNPGFASFTGTGGIGGMSFADTLNPANSLEATLAFLAPQPSSVDFLQVIVQSGQTANLKMFVEDSNAAGTSFDLLIGEIAPPASGNPPAGDISGLLQGAFDNRNGGPAIVPISITGGNVTGFSLLADDPSLQSFLSFSDDPTTEEAGNYLLGLNGPFDTLPPGTLLSGSLTVFTDNGDVLYTFENVSIPEPSTVALASLAAIGLVGFARRKKS